jgi:hypothetical protein
MDDRFHLAAGVRPSSGGPELEGSPMADVFADDTRREGCPECERRRDRNRTVAKVGCVLLVAVAAALAIKRYPAWAESIKVGVIVLVVVVTWLLARDGYDRSS